ncbi:MAG: VIT1/CCC1 transporter family protein [Reyranella sp.]
MSTGFIHRYLDPSESLLEVLFGLIMSLTLTAGARLLSERQDIDAASLAAALVGCNVAWGIIDAVFYLLGTRFSRNQRVQFVRRLRATTDDSQAFDAIREEFGLEGEPPMREEDRAAFYRSLLQMLRHAGTKRARFLRDDFVAAVVIVLLVSATAIPAALPLLLLSDGYGALRVANILQIFLLFLVGYGWAHYSGANPWSTGIMIALLGVGLVLVSVALGG